MKYTFLGRSGLRVSRLCLGTYNFGTHTDEAEAFRIMDAALDGGINVIDTANHYPDFVNCGLSEEIIGRWLAQGGGRRERVVLATKVYQPMKDPLDGPNDDPGLSLYKIRRHLEGSLRRLQTDHIELYQMHHIDRRTAWDETWEAFESLVRRGQVDYVGSSNFAGWHLAQAQAAAKARGFMGLISEQHRYNLFCRIPELEVLPAAAGMGIGVLAYSPLQGGMLGGRMSKPGSGTRSAGMTRWADGHRATLEAFRTLSSELAQPEAVVALAWILHHRAVTGVVIGPRTADQVHSALAAAELVLDDDVVARLDTIFPGPGGEAPEAYAW